MNYQKLKGKLTEEKKSYIECALHIGISTTAFSNKMNMKSVFSVVEANKLANFLNLSQIERIEIFLPNNLHVVQ